MSDLTTLIKLLKKVTPDDLEFETISGERGDFQLLRISTNNTDINGYNMFFNEYIFDMEGNITGMGIWE